MTFSRTSPDHAHLIGMHAAEGRTAEPSALCLVLHGGRSVSEAEVLAGHIAVLRMRPVARVLARALPSVAVYRLQLSIRGWNGSGAAPVRDARWAVRTLRALHPDVPIVLVGHSMGGRTVLRVADEPAVVGVVGLAPWLPADEPIAHLGAVAVRLVHGDRDRIVPEPSTRAVVARLLTAGVDVRRSVLPGTGHGMVRGWRRWNAEVVAAVTALLGAARRTGPGSPVDPAAGNPGDRVRSEPEH
ncbi:alpha/beta hydrolase [Nakamurella deserti]|uniref:alpha/beta hydrolase n=1 Tax=Nakamurella deserti TaxID=2164074 RepID=UPI000DBE494D|nr:alpha/beta hydrolase [Nakamurella deserti]